MTRLQSGCASVLVATALAGSPPVLDGAVTGERRVMFAGMSEVATSTGCERLTLTVDQTTTDGATATWLQYFVVDKCRRDAVIASGAGLIPNAAFSLAASGATARLQTTTVESGTGASGRIDVTWTMTDVESWSATNTWRNQLRDVVRIGRRSDEQRSADIVGSIVGLNVTGTGQFGWSSVTETQQSGK